MSVTKKDSIDEKLLEELSIRLTSELIRNGETKEYISHMSGTGINTVRKMFMRGTGFTHTLLRIADILHCDVVLVRRIVAPLPTGPKVKIKRIKEKKYKYIEDGKRTLKAAYTRKGGKVGRPRTLREKGPVITVPVLRGWEPGKPQRPSKKRDFDRAIEQRDFLADDDPQQPDGQA